MTAVSIRDSGRVESLVSGLALVDALVDGVVDAGTLSLALGVGFELALGFGNERLVELLLVLTSHSALYYALPLIGGGIRFRVPSAVLFYRSCDRDPAIIH